MRGLYLGAPQTVEENWHGGMGPDTVHTGSLCPPRRETPLPFVVVTHELSIAVLLGLDMAFKTAEGNAGECLISLESGLIPLPQSRSWPAHSTTV